MVGGCERGDLYDARFRKRKDFRMGKYGYWKIKGSSFVFIFIFFLFSKKMHIFLQRGNFDHNTVP